MLKTFSIKCKAEHVSDGYHSMAELYDHRCLLFVFCMRSNQNISWRARRHHDGKTDPDWFLAGMQLPTGQITYHLPSTMWNLLDRTEIETLEYAPKWDGHGSRDVLNRMAELFSMESQ